MPLYEYECRSCERRRTEFRQVDQRHDAPECHGRSMALVICPPQVVADIPGYVSPVSGKWIEGRAARKADLAATNSRPWEGFAAEKKEAERRKAHAEQKFDQKIEAAARQAFHELPPAKRRALETP